ncbi:MAG: PepSY domain-containing protein [Methylovirgula sp.]
MSEARTIALKAFPGKIIKSELEHEHGGSGLRYSFDMRQGTKWREVGVDAMTGQVLENSPEGANPKD